MTFTDTRPKEEANISFEFPLTLKEEFGEIRAKPTKVDSLGGNTVFNISYLKIAPPKISSLTGISDSVGLPRSLAVNFTQHAGRPALLGYCADIVDRCFTFASGE